MLLGAACSSDDGSTEPRESAIDPLPADELVAVCLTDREPDRADGGSIKTDLCTVSLDGQRSVIRPDVDASQRVALSPERTRVAFIEDGALRMVGIDGSGEVDTGARGSDPEWIDRGHVGLITDDRTITSVDTATHGTSVLLDGDLVADVMPAAVIDGFAVSTDGDDVLFTFTERAHEGGGFVPGDRSALGHLDTTRGEAELLIGPLDEPLADPEFGPGTEFVLSRDSDIHRGELRSSTTTLVSADQLLGVTPAWSQDGKHIAWLTNSVGGPEVVLVYLPAGSTPAQVAVTIVGDRGGPLERFPAFPDW